MIVVELSSDEFSEIAQDTGAKVYQRIDVESTDCSGDAALTKWFLDPSDGFLLYATTQII